MPTPPTIDETPVVVSDDTNETAEPMIKTEPTSTDDNGSQSPEIDNNDNDSDHQSERTLASDDQNTARRNPARTTRFTGSYSDMRQYVSQGLRRLGTPRSAPRGIGLRK